MTPWDSVHADPAYETVFADMKAELQRLRKTYEVPLNSPR